MEGSAGNPQAQVTIAQEPARLLHRDSSHGYTDRPALALPEEPEAIPQEEQQHMSDVSRLNWDVATAREKAALETRSRCNRLRQAEIRGRRRRIDFTRQLAEVERAISQLERAVA